MRAAIVAQVHRVLTERHILSAVDHPFLATMYATLQTESHLHLLLEYCAGARLLGNGVRLLGPSNAVYAPVGFAPVQASICMESTGVGWRGRCGPISPEHLCVAADAAVPRVASASLGIQCKQNGF